MASFEYSTHEKDTARAYFFWDTRPNAAASEKEGLPVEDRIEMVKIVTPGDRLTNYIGEVRDVDRARFSKDYDAFKRGAPREVSGTPVVQWANPLVNRSLVALLQSLDILTVQELAEIADSVLPSIGMGARKLRDQARAYVAAAKDNAYSAKMAAENSELRERIERLEKGGIAPQGVQTSEPKPIEDCSDADLKAFIKRETGEAPKGRVSRDTLVKRVSELANANAPA